MMLLVTYGAWVFSFTQCWQGEEVIAFFFFNLQLQHAAQIPVFIKILRDCFTDLHAEQKALKWNCLLKRHTETRFILQLVSGLLSSLPHGQRIPKTCSSLRGNSVCKSMSSFCFF